MQDSVDLLVTTLFMSAAQTNTELQQRLRLSKRERHLAKYVTSITIFTKTSTNGLIVTLMCLVELRLPFTLKSLKVSLMTFIQVEKPTKKSLINYFAQVVTDSLQTDMFAVSAQCAIMMTLKEINVMVVEN